MVVVVMEVEVLWSQAPVASCLKHHHQGLISPSAEQRSRGERSALRAGPRRAAQPGPADRRSSPEMEDEGKE